VYVDAETPVVGYGAPLDSGPRHNVIMCVFGIAEYFVYNHRPVASIHVCVTVDNPNTFFQQVRQHKDKVSRSSSRLTFASVPTLARFAVLVHKRDAIHFVLKGKRSLTLPPRTYVIACNSIENRPGFKYEIHSISSQVPNDGAQ